MALSKLLLDTTGSGSRGGKVHATYGDGANTDAKATIKADGYFDSLYNELGRVGSMTIYASDATFDVKVTVSGTDVALAALDTYA